MRRPEAEDRLTPPPACGWVVATSSALPVPTRTDGAAMRMVSRVRAWGDRLRSSLFFVPMLCVLLGAILGQVLLGVDALVTGIDERLTATVESARTVLTTVAGATLTFAAILGRKEWNE